MSILNAENQKVHIEYLKSEMQVGYTEKDPTNWEVQRGYIPTTIVRDSLGNEVSECIDFVVIDDNAIAWRISGQYREDGEWEISSPVDFAYAVIEDAENHLEGYEADQEREEWNRQQAERIADAEWIEEEKSIDR